MESKWISIVDELPPHDVVIIGTQLVEDRGYFTNVEMGWWYGELNDGGSLAVDGMDGDWFPVSHWMYAPEPPSIF